MVGSRQRATQENETIFRQGVLRRGERAPDGGSAGDGLVVRGEGLYLQQANSITLAHHEVTELIAVGLMTAHGSQDS